MGRLGQDRVGERVAVHVAAHHPAGQGRVLVDPHRLVLDHRSIVHRCDGDGHRGLTGVERAVRRGEAELIAPVEVREGLEKKPTAHGIESQRAVLRPGGHREGEHGSVDVGGDDLAGVCRVLVEGHRLVQGSWRVVHRDHRERNGGCLGRVRSVGDGEGELIGTVVVGERSVGELAGSRVERDLAMAWRRDQVVGDDRSVTPRVDQSGDGHVLAGRERLVERVRSAGTLARTQGQHGRDEDGPSGGAARHVRQVIPPTKLAPGSGHRSSPGRRE